MAAAGSGQSVLKHADLSPQILAGVLARFGLRLQVSAVNSPIPGSYWGDCEAGLIGEVLFARND